MSTLNRSKGHWQQAKLTTEQVQEIRALYAAGGTSTGKLAKQYGVSRQLIYTIVIGKARKEA